MKLRATVPVEKQGPFLCLCLVVNDFVSLFNFCVSHLRDNALLGPKPLNVFVFPSSQRGGMYI